jgi:hypothetical protein
VTAITLLWIIAGSAVESLALGTALIAVPAILCRA